jgi:hypothetical protein
VSAAPRHAPPRADVQAAHTWNVALDDATVDRIARRVVALLAGEDAQLVDVGTLPDDVSSTRVFA